MESIKIFATIEKIIYQSPSTWYTVCDALLDTAELITVVGTMPYASVGEKIEATGTYITSKDYGKQFKVDSYNKNLPENKNDILKYLSSGAIKGIGAKIAKKIVDMYGDETFDVIENHPSWLTEISGISRKKAYDISFDFKEKSDVREIMTISRGLISPESSVKIHQKFGKNAVEILKENPYLLCGETFGVNFKKADEIAFNYGIKPDSENRITAGIKYVLGVYASRDGHTYVNREVLVDSTSKYLGINKAPIETLLDREGGVNGVSLIMHENTPCVARSDLYFAEINISKRLLHINRKAIVLENANLEYVVSDLEARDGIKYASLQKKAIYEALKNGVMVLTGGPGTGKTTVIKALISIFNNLSISCALCAPTGRASKRMSEATGNESKTIHRLLEVVTGADIEGEPRFARNHNNPLDQDVIIVDEASMIDVPLMSSLLNAIKTGSRLILIGDTSQLPSVGEGNVLNDIIASERFSVVCLNEIFRQSSNSGIVTNAHKINKGICPELSEKYDDFFFVEKSEDLIPEYITNLCKNRLPRKYGKDAFEYVQIISPSKKGICGTANLNYTLQNELNPYSERKAQINKGQNKVFRQGDKIMQTKNNYDIEWTDEKNGINVVGTGVFNGDVGFIKSISESSITVDYQGKTVEYPSGELDELEHSYAITVHKSQGSEYPIVIIPISESCPYVLLTRNLIYTAITRAEKMVIVVGSKEIFYKMVENNTEILRNTMLKKLLKKGEQ